MASCEILRRIRGAPPLPALFRNGRGDMPSAKIPRKTRVALAQPPLTTSRFPTTARNMHILMDGKPVLCPARPVPPRTDATRPP